MKKESNHNKIDGIDFHLDITSEICPLTFVKTKLLIEKMAAGQVLQVRLKGAEPLENVPRSAREQGHAILAMEPEDADAGPDGVHILTIRKG
jgi:TusA-related sulfurtransferase